MLRSRREAFTIPDEATERHQLPFAQKIVVAAAAHYLYWPLNKLFTTQI